MMLPTAFPLVAGLTRPSLHGMPSLHGSCSSACPVVPARLVQMAATSSSQPLGPAPNRCQIL
eukprot:scaffold61668_cov60-Phaeocystis_antarctica.AAC.1